LQLIVSDWKNQKKTRYLHQKDISDVPITLPVIPRPLAAANLVELYPQKLGEPKKIETALLYVASYR